MCERTNQQNCSKPNTEGPTTDRGAEDRYPVAAVLRLACFYGRNR